MANCWGSTADNPTPSTTAYLNSASINATCWTDYPSVDWTMPMFLGSTV
ncbi:hypothetical protein CIPAW_04G014800 [Carya illinoinensis]|uniref:Uncharacterized protein n=1 Tax=Carya illinoinensis TaxID=32201 RepID=A0A8T1QPD0_CARIL|nr:hypothetical protein CIPAW_04G014800 [Carya illinoinensis]